MAAPNLQDLREKLAALADKVVDRLADLVDAVRERRSRAGPPPALPKLRGVLRPRAPEPGALPEPGDAEVRIGERTDPALPRMMGISLGVHLLLLVLLLSVSSTQPKMEAFKPETVYNVSLVGGPPGESAAAAPAEKPAPPVPEETVFREPEPEPAPPPELPAEKPEPAPVKREAKPAPPKETPKEKKEPEKAEEPQDDISKALAKMESKVGSHAEGAGEGGAEGGGVENLRFRIYYDVLWKKVKKSWVLPNTLESESKSYETVVAVKIARDGTLVEKWIETPSGNPILDEAALRAVIRSAPFPPVPFGLGEDFFEIGIRFHTGDLQREGR